MGKTTKQQELVFLLEYSLDIGDDMVVDVEEVLNKMRESGGGKILTVSIRDKAS